MMTNMVLNDINFFLGVLGVIRFDSRKEAVRSDLSYSHLIKFHDVTFKFRCYLNYFRKLVVAYSSLYSHGVKCVQMIILHTHFTAADVLVSQLYPK